MKFNFKRIIQFELNEVSKIAVDTLIAKGKLPHFKQINEQWTYLETTSEYTYELLEPWIQWITAHTGKTFAEHQIFHLSDAVHLKHPQIWETLSAQGIESGIVGSMNALRGETKGGFFFPDPWSKKGATYPQNIQPLWDLISKKVQSHATASITFSDLWKSLKICRAFKFPFSLYQRIAYQLISQKLDPFMRWKLPGIFDLFLTQIFKWLLSVSNYSFYTLFLNACAHYQHHYWRNFQPELFNKKIKSPDCQPHHDPLTYGLELYDNIIALALELAKDPETLVLIVTGLSQVPFTEKENEGGMNYYRLYDHKALLKKLSLNNYRVVPLMSRDWQIEAKMQSELDQAKIRLSHLSVNNHPLFRITQNTPCSLFIETAFTKGIQEETEIRDLKKSIGSFINYFCNIAVKSGHHQGIGSIWSSANLPFDNPQIPLTTLYPFTLETLGVTSRDNVNIVQRRTETFVPQ